MYITTHVIKIIILSSYEISTDESLITKSLLTLPFTPNSKKSSHTHVRTKITLISILGDVSPRLIYLII